MNRSQKRSSKDEVKIFYWDTSALLSLVFYEPDSSKIQKFIKEESALPGYTSFFTAIEMESALFRRIQEGSLLSEVGAVREAYSRINSLIAYLWADELLLNRSKRCAFDFGLRPGDSLQLATAMEISSEVKSLVFVTLDLKLKKCATAAGLTTALRE